MSHSLLLTHMERKPEEAPQDPQWAVTELALKLDHPQTCISLHAVWPLHVISCAQAASQVENQFLPKQIIQPYLSQGFVQSKEVMNNFPCKQPLQNTKAVNQQ